MVYYLKVYVAALVGFFAIDIVWLAVVAHGFYRKHLGFLLADQPNWWAAIPFYLLFVSGMVVFVVAPALQAGSIWRALLLGAFFGLVTYATYDLTNHATLRNWALQITLVDIAWGSFVSAVAAAAGFWAGARAGGAA